MQPETWPPNPKRVRKRLIFDNPDRFDNAEEHKQDGSLPSSQQWNVDSESSAEEPDGDDPAFELKSSHSEDLRDEIGKLVADITKNHTLSFKDLKDQGLLLSSPLKTVPVEAIKKAIKNAKARDRYVKKSQNQ
jgi:hypothetical protein